MPDANPPPAPPTSGGTILGNTTPANPTVPLSSGTSTATPGAPAAPAQPELPDWMKSHQGWAGDDAGYVANKKLDPPGLLKGYRELERLMGDPKTLARIPKADDEKGWNEFWGRLGRPAEGTPEAYELAAAEGSDPTLAKGLAQAAHKAGLTKAQLHAIVDFHHAQTAAHEQAEAAAMEARIDADTNELRVEYGAAFEQKLATADKAAQRYGLSKEWQVKYQQAFGPKALIEHLVRLGEGMGEAPWRSGEQAANRSLSPGEAQAALDALMTPDFQNRLVTNRLTADERREYDRLFKMRYPDAAPAPR